MMMMIMMMMMMMGMAMANSPNDGLTTCLYEPCDSQAPVPLPPLPYPYDSLEPSIDNQTMTFHHDKHFAGYTKKMNTALPLRFARAFYRQPNDDVPSRQTLCRLHKKNEHCLTPTIRSSLLSTTKR